MKKFLFLFLLSLFIVFAFTACGDDESSNKGNGATPCPDDQHTMSPWEIKTEAFCTTTGQKIRYCLKCNLYEETAQYINTTNHKYENYVCIYCGAQTTPAKVAYQMSDDGTYYILNVVSDKSATEYVVPSEYQGLPVREIAPGAFEGCTRLHTVVVPDSITRIGEGAFKGCYSIKNITLPFVGRDATSKYSAFGYIFGTPENKNGMVGTTQYIDGVSTEFWIPENLVEITITGGEIKDNAFRNCSKIKRVEYKGTGDTIGNYAFSGCSSLDVFTFPLTVSTLGDRAFQKCIELDTLPLDEGIVKIGDYCFAGCLFTYLELPSTLTTAGTGAFAECINLKNVVIPSSLRNLPNGMFQDCKAITSLTVRSGVRSIGRSCFSGCTLLETIDLSNTVKKIEKLAFNGCTSIKEITLAPTVELIEEGAFQNCSLLETINLGTSLVTIESLAFSGCTSLKEISLPKTVEEIEENAFHKCSALSVINVEEGNNSFCSVNGHIYNTAKTRLLYVAPGFSGEEMIIPEGVTEIDVGAFNNAISIKKVVFPSSITEIPNELFKNNKSIKSLSITSSIVKIGKAAFQDSALEEIEISRVQYIEEDAFRQCESLKTVTIDNVHSIGKGAFLNCKKLATLNISNVNQIGENAFAECKSIKELDLTKSVSIISKEAFYNCSGITKLMLGSGVEVIGEFSFSGCSSLVDLTFEDGISKIEDAAFQGCKSLTKVVLPGTLTSVTAYAFEGCTSLVEFEIAESEMPPVYGTLEGHLIKIDFSSGSLRYVLAIFAPGLIQETIELPGVDEIGIFAFRNITGFKHIIVNPETKVIGREAFFNSSLETIDFANVEIVGDYAFGHCMKLKEFVVPETIKSLGNYVFQYCYNLDKLYLRSTLESVGKAILMKNSEDEEYREKKTEIFVETAKDDLNDKKVPEGWDEFWSSASNSNITYGFDFSVIDNPQG